MKILALDTSTEACSAAVLVDDEVIERYELAPRRHATLILPMIEAVLAEAGLVTSQLNALAFGRGPGAFTGVRIAASVVQGIAFAADLPVLPVSSLAAIAHEVMNEYDARHVLAAIDARMGEIYLGAYSADGDNGALLIGQERVCLPEAVSAPDDQEWTGAGTGWAIHAEVLSQGSSVKVWWSEIYPRAGEIAALGALAWQRGDMVSAEDAIPVYLRDEVTTKRK